MSTPVGPYTPIVRAGSFLYASGQLGLLDGALVEGVAAQTAQALRNLAALVELEGATLDQVVKTTVFLADMEDFLTMNEAYVAGFGDHRPARSAVAVAALPLGAAVEIEAVIHIG
ncbi:MAG: Rid family detoxifying hydrolase [Microthrixaceae bacterium]|nr:Rid family detoxifying hydrolase [Microthrixaceae bacterium]